ncbi:peptidoglycan DD-metalloendopeptidase family protein [Streptomyces sp. NPDC008001]|uniref:peptidoglycan DD-metalloendopeptidase family protein n=1 Tax=Streptomyces sp. NPDC008001 TaxID=3364804 RepID=UPI0036E88853
MVNDRHPAAGPNPSVPAQDGSYGHYASYGQQSAPHNYTGYDGHDSGQWETTGWGQHPDETWGSNTTSQWGVTGQTQIWDFSAYTAMDGSGQPDATGQWDTSGAIATPPTGQWDTSAMTPSAWGADGAYDTSGHWEMTGQTEFPGHGWDANGTGQFSSPAAAWDTGAGQTGTTGQASGHWDTSGGQWDTSGGSGQWDTSGAGNQWDTGAGQTQTWDTSAYAAMDAAPGPAAGEPQHAPTLMTDLSGIQAMEAAGSQASAGAAGAAGAAEDSGPQSHEGLSPAGAVANAETQAMLFVPPARDGDEAGPGDDAPGEARAHGRDGHGRDGHGRDGHGRDGRSGDARSRAGRRKSAPARSSYRPRRKALLTIAVPSAAVIGVAGIAAATVSGGQSDAKPQAASTPDSAPAPAMANSKLDTQLASLSHGADDFASRANRTQERLDLKARQEEEKKRKAEEAARKEAERPKYSLPVTQHGLSAYYGQAGVNWMSVHTGIDFPVAYGTPVMAATDGTVRTQYNVAYGNMAIVTSPDGVETWYCHLSSTKLRSGQVKAGDVIAYSGNSGNSTGPHLHFEVRPGGSAVDPLPWLRAHGFDPT